MADYTKINGVAAADIVKLDGAAIADVAKYDGTDKPASGATVWVVAHDDRDISWIANQYLTGSSEEWATYDSFAGGSSPNPSSGVDHIKIAYGKDGSGNPLWMGTHASDSCELSYHDDHSSGPWTGINNDASGSTITGRRFNIQWGNDYWVAVGKMNTKNVHRSPDGVNWEQVDVSGVTDIGTAAIYALASNGTGTWWFAQNNRIYESTDDAASWSLKHTLVDSSNADPGDIRALIYTNNSLVAGVDGAGEVFSAASSDLTDWSTETSISNHSSAVFDQQTHVAAANGRVVCVGGQLKTTFDVSGKTITMDENGVDFSSDSHGTLSSVSTDGTTWLATCFTGDTFVSTNGGDSWTLVATNVGSLDILDSAPDVFLPL